MPKKKLTQQEFYCLMCRAYVKLHRDDICFDEDRNGRPRLIGYCDYCDCNLYKYVKEKDADRLADKYGWC